MLQLVSVLGIHASSICVSALLDGLQIAGQPFDREALLTPEQARIKAAFTAGRGRLSDRWEALLRPIRHVSRPTPASPRILGRPAR